MDCLTKYFDVKTVKSRIPKLNAEVDGSAESSFYAAINQSTILDTTETIDKGNARLIFLTRTDIEKEEKELEEEEGEVVDGDGRKQQQQQQHNEIECDSDNHLHLELDMRKCDAARERLRQELLSKREKIQKNTPYSISTVGFSLLQKAFLLEYATNECVKKLDRMVTKRVSESTELGDKINKSIFACTINTLIKNKLTEAEVEAVKLFLPPVYEIPDQFNAKILLAKYVEQYYAACGDDDDNNLRLLKDFYMSLKFHHIDGEQSLYAFYKHVAASERDGRPSTDVQRFTNACNHVVFAIALNYYNFRYDICRLDRELEELLVTETKDCTKDLIRFDKKKIYYVPRKNCFYAIKDDNDLLLKSSTMSSLFCELV